MMRSCGIQRMRRRSAPRAALLACLIGFGVVGCAAGSEDDGTSSAQPDQPLSSTAERGPVRCTVSTPQRDVDVGDRIKVTLHVSAANGVEINMPELGEQWGPFTVLDAHTPPDVPGEERRTWTHTYTLDTFESGDVQLPSVEFTFRDGREDRDNPVEGEISSEPLTLHVRSIVDVAGDQTYRDIKEGVNVPVPGDPRRWWVLAGLVVGAVAVLASALMTIRRLMRQRVASPVPAHEWAMKELAALEAAQLLARGEMYEFYTRLSDVVRQYIERRFALMAPERTTEEFLREIERGSALNAERRRLLNDFLRAADLVKFARHQPTSADGVAALASARSFVEQTAPVASEVDESPQREEAPA